MRHDAHPTVELHNVAETTDPDWTDAGHRLCRVPEAVGAELNVVARDRVRDPTGVELRFVPEDDEASVAVTLSAAGETTVHPFWGPYQSDEPFALGPEPTTHELSVPERVGRLDAAAVERGAFAPRVCRLRFDAWGGVALHDVEGPCRPPNEAELPETRYLAYGTSITEGALSAPHLSYVSQAARTAGVDPLNLGMAGSAYCEPAIAAHIAGREDWDVATLSLSVNMANRGFTVEQFRERAAHLVETVAGAHPEKPVVCLTLFPYHGDVVVGDDPGRATAYRDALRGVVADSPHANVSLVEGPDLMDATGLMTDVLHPGDDGMIDIGRALGRELAARLE